jgi:DNA phosphorothioation-associated putative methyltransferase
MTRRNTLETPSTLGKIVGNDLYAHATLFQQLDDQMRGTLSAASALAGLTAEQDFNVARIAKDGKTCSLLSYPDFFDDPFPPLQRSWRVDLERQTVNFRSYADSVNPPILHRKELLLPQEHPRVADFHAITAAAESLGLFRESARIGFRNTWQSLIAERGYRLEGDRFVPITLQEASGSSSARRGDDINWVARHRTALTRYSFSAPVQALLRHGLLDDGVALFDYGCGRGDDIRGLQENGFSASGWDPHFAPHEQRKPARVVNLGFVINVIENFDERVGALRGAFDLTEGVLSVSAMLASSSPIQGRPFKDGYVSQRGTFQKYYSQAELRDFIEHCLDEIAVPVGPGVFFVFRDKDLEQRFLSSRFSSRQLYTIARWRPPRVERLRRPSATDRKYEQYRPLLEALWERWLELGREPHPSELRNRQEIEEKLGSVGRALRLLVQRQDLAQLDAAAEQRRGDLTTYFALQQFEHRQRYQHLEAGIQRDIKALFGSYGAAQDIARRALFGIADTAALEEACRQAANQGLGFLDEGHSLQLHTSLVARLPPILRIYVGCATVLYGDIEGADLVKIHITSGKLTLMEFDDFLGTPLPRMTRRVKIKMRRQSFDLFEYGGDYPAPFLYHKSRYINEDFRRYPEQVVFETALDGLHLFDLSGYGPPAAEFLRKLEGARWSIDGFQLVRSQRVPGLDEPCGRYFTYRQFLECGKADARAKPPNPPEEPDSYTALYDLAVNVLDPVVDYFGMITLTFCSYSPELAQTMKGVVDRKADQHAAHALVRKENPNFPRLGAAVEFVIEDEDMQEVANWIAKNTPVDVLRLHDHNRRLHVSHGASKLLRK